MFTVIWRTDALDLLADLYVTLDATHRAILASSVHAMNSALYRDPTTVGRPRRRGHRIAVIPFLVVQFRIDDANQVVRVFRVRPTRS